MSSQNSYFLSDFDHIIRVCLSGLPSLCWPVEVVIRYLVNDFEARFGVSMSFLFALSTIFLIIMFVAVIPALFNSSHLGEISSISFHSLLLLSNDPLQQPKRASADSQDFATSTFLLQLKQVQLPEIDFLRNSYQPFASYKTSLPT